MLNRKEFARDTFRVLFFIALLALFLMLARMAWADTTTIHDTSGKEWKTYTCTSGAGSTVCF